MGLLRSLIVCAALLVPLSACPTPQLFDWTPVEPLVLSPDKERVELLFTGDLSVARGITEAIDKEGNGDPAWVFEPLGGLLHSVDMVFANLECVLSDTDEGKTDKTYAIRAATRYASKLKESGIDVVSVTNNHALDFGHGGFASTLRTTHDEGLAVTGVLDKDGQRPLVLRVGQMKVGIIGENAAGDEWRPPRGVPRPQLYELDDTQALVEQLRPLVDLLIVSIHWGPELSHEPWPWQEEHAHALVDAGADLIIGHHPHVPQPVEQYRGALIAYSLGDLLFDKQSQWLRHRTGQRFFLKVGFTGKQRTSFELIPVNHDQFWRPHVEPTQDTQSFLKVPDSAAWRASAQLEDADVERVKGADVTRCSSWDKQRVVIKAGWLRWLAPRFKCFDDDEAPELVVAPTAEIAGTVLRKGIWAPPNDDTVRLHWDRVPFGAVLQLYGAFNDWVIQSEADRRPRADGPSTLVVKSSDRVLLNTTLAFRRGWQDLPPIDTRALAGTRAPLTLEIQGAKRKAPGFVIEALVPSSVPR